MDALSTLSQCLNSQQHNNSGPIFTQLLTINDSKMFAFQTLLAFMLEQRSELCILDGTGTCQILSFKNVENVSPYYRITLSIIMTKTFFHPHFTCTIKSIYSKKYLLKLFSLHVFPYCNEII